MKRLSQRGRGTLPSARETRYSFLIRHPVLRNGERGEAGTPGPPRRSGPALCSPPPCWQLPPKLRGHLQTQLPRLKDWEGGAGIKRPSPFVFQGEPAWELCSPPAPRAPLGSWPSLASPATSALRPFLEAPLLDTRGRHALI